MRNVVVEIADLQVSNDPDTVLVTYALGSCIAVILHDRAHAIGGMIHYMLPQSEPGSAKAEERPAMFADTGVPMLFRRMYELGCRKEDLTVKVAGGGALYDDGGLFNIGKRNYVMLRKLFWKNGILITAEDVGGAKSRTVRLQVGTGICTLLSQGEEAEL